MDSVKPLLIDVLNRALHTVLSVDPDCAQEFGALTGKVFCIELTVPAITLYLHPDPDGFTLSETTTQTPDVTMTGSIFAFAKLSGKGAASEVLSDGQVTLHGDAEAGQQLQKILSRFDFDWEQLIAGIIGDTPARKTGNVIRNTADWASKTTALSRTNLAEYLQEEKRVLVTEVAMERFTNAVTALRADTDRAAQRLEQLRQRADQWTGRE